jgi:hypothetical protein
VDFFIKPRLNYRNFVADGLTRVFHMQPEAKHHLTVIVDGTIAVAYIDNEIAFSMRMCSLKGTRLGIFARHGGLTVSDARISTHLSD